MSERHATTDSPDRVGPVAADRPTVPGFEVLEELGRGGMGVVFRARQINLKRMVALKLIRDGALAGPQQRARFGIEAEAAARMRHANVVAIYDVGEHQGQPYFAMELVEGPSLEEHIAGQPQPPVQAARLLRALAGAVEHAHGQNVVHRDLKPANILLGADHTPKITDFGLAKRLDSESTAWTREGAVVGTASYMAPEQAAGRTHDIGPAADLYALGAILYTLLTGRPPFLADSWQQTLEQVLHEEPVPPSRLRPDLPPDLETICLKCLEKEPSRRYASATALADDLDRFLASKPVAAVPLSLAERVARHAARDGYQLLGEIGRGPDATVYHARYSALPQPVALKVFRAATSPRPEWEGRLQRHADLWTALAHPNVVPIQRAGWWESAPYIAMEYVPHGSLAGRLAGTPYAVADALRLVEQLAEVLAYLHRQGVVHGNLKPSNILFAADGIPRVSDWRPIDGLFHVPATSTDLARISYLAPEAIREPAAEPRPYTDIYGLGIILYELLTGTPPFIGSTAAEIEEQVVQHEPVPPSQLNPKVTPPVEACCLRCLHKDPWRRYTRAYDLLMRLRNIQRDPDSRDAPSQPASRRRAYRPL